MLADEFTGLLLLALKVAVLVYAPQLDADVVLVM
jgi:hypothetical protein